MDYEDKGLRFYIYLIRLKINYTHCLIFEYPKNLFLILLVFITAIEIDNKILTRFFGIGILLYYKGGRIQKIVLEKSIVTDVRFAFIINLIYFFF